MSVTTVAARPATRGHRARARTPRVAIAACGGLLIGWIVVQLAFIREVSFFHPLYLAFGLWMAWFGATMATERAGVARQAR